MTEPVVLQRKDPNGHTVLSWYESEGDACLDDYIAEVSHYLLLTTRHTPPNVRLLAHGLFGNELLRDPQADLSWLTTHHQVEPGGPIEPNRETKAAEALKRDMAETILAVDGALQRRMREPGWSQ